MTGESSTPAGAVFLSYASEDTDAAQRICEALSAAGIEVWFDKSELRGGDAWDRHIRDQIQQCRLFLPLISSHSEARDEGYFRREWRLAVERAGDMDERRAFIVPVVIDDTSERSAHVPDKFRDVQWTRLPGGTAPSTFVDRVQRLLSGEPPAPSRPHLSSGVIRASGWSMRVLPVMAVLLIGVSKPVAASAAAFAPPPHSVAVLPFVNMSGDKEQEYFSDGLTEELLNSLAGINELQVAGRTSAFSFKGKDTDLGTIARKLNVGAILEGSVRRSGHTIRISTELINAVTGFQLWSKSYDRDLGDVLKLQTEIATAVAGALRVTLLGDIAQKIELGGTRNPAAFDAYLRASRVFQSIRNEATDIPVAIAAYTEAIRRDPNYALAFAGRSYAFGYYAGDVATGVGVREGFEKAESDARHALALAPDLAEAHVALAFVFGNGNQDFARAQQEYERAMVLAPGNAKVLRDSGAFAAYMGHFNAGIAAARHAVVLDPLDNYSHAGLGRAFYVARRYQEAATAYAEAISLNPENMPAYGSRGIVLYALGDLDHARASCEGHRDSWLSQECLAVVYQKLGYHGDAAAELQKMHSALGDAFAFEYAKIYAQWGDHAKALDWLETAKRLHDPGLAELKTTPLLDPLRQEPRFQAVMRALKFPD
jgi:TolB-like protein